MKKTTCISVFLISILMGSVLFFSISSVKTYIETIELTEDGESNTQNLLEEEEHMFGVSFKNNSLLNKKVLYFIFDTPVLNNVFDVLTQPPLK